MVMTWRTVIIETSVNIKSYLQLMYIFVYRVLDKKVTFSSILFCLVYNVCKSKKYGKIYSSKAWSLLNLHAINFPHYISSDYLNVTK